MGFSRFLAHFNALMYKNVLFTKRRWKLTVMQLLCPLVFVSLLYFVDMLPKDIRDNPYNPLIRDINPPIQEFGSIQRCRLWNGVPCKTVRYVIPPRDDYTTLMQYVIEQSGLPVEEFEQMADRDSLVDYIKQHPNTTTNALIFNDDVDTEYRYTLMYNSTLDPIMIFSPARKPENRNELHIAVDQAIFRFHYNRHLRSQLVTSVGDTDTNVTDQISAQQAREMLHFNKKAYPKLGFRSGESASDDLGPVFFYCGIMFQFIILLYNVCSEKDTRLVQYLRLNGMVDSAYYFSVVVWGTIVSMIAVAVLYLTGYALRLKFFVNVNAGVIFLLFGVFSVAMTAFALFNYVFIQRAKSSLNIGMLHFILGLLIVAIVGKTQAKDALNNPDTVNSIVPVILSLLFPSYNLAEGFCEISTKLQASESARYHWSDLWQVRYHNETVNDSVYPPVIKQIPMPTLEYSVFMLAVNFVMFGVLAVYLDQILSNADSEGFYWYEPFLPRFWNNKWFNVKKYDFHKLLRLLNIQQRGTQQSSLRMDVVQMEQDVADLIESDQVMSGNAPLLQVYGLTKVYKSSTSLLNSNNKNEFKAVNQIWFSADQGEILAILGRNGAGKSTTVNMLVGLIKSTYGDALIDGKLFSKQSFDIRKILGVCSQQDILFKELTPLEHMIMLSKIKMMDSVQASRQIEFLLHSVNLWQQRYRPVYQFSGGMKRRLCAAMAFLHAKVVILDECTSGVDPYIRRDLWNLIQEMKQNRLILLITHSMEECDVLSDKVLIMKNGGIECCGTSLSLKSRFGALNLELLLDCSHLDQSISEYKLHLIEAIQRYCPAASMESFTQQHLETQYLAVVNVPQEDDQFYELLKQLQGGDKLKQIIKISVKRTGLEDVFVKVTQ
ncbi:hypothetical protein MIR68_007233 [Amoeboaphelidium protococcarum]|nr:hypothetical protein MIR68_007233 [Amoeboaphelidium protococcarum]